MTGQLPVEVIKHVRKIFLKANREVSEAMADQPAIHEETLDHLLVTTVGRAGPTILPETKAALLVETHWIGGRRHFGRWEIADIALVAVLRRGGSLIWRKVALLQSKRLYSKDIEVHEQDDFEEVLGIGRLIDRIEPTVPLYTPRAFSFDQDSEYGQLRAANKQVARIDQYVAERKIPVFYSLYNPPMLPLRGTIPLALGSRAKVKNLLGCRVLRSADVHASLSKLEDYSAAKFKELAIRHAPTGRDIFARQGWRLENFVADEFLMCREGRRFEEAQDPDLNYLLYRRSAPIQSAIVMTIDLPSSQP